MQINCSAVVKFHYVMASNLESLPDIAEILLKLALNTNQSINQSNHRNYCSVQHIFNTLR